MIGGKQPEGGAAAGAADAPADSERPGGLLSRIAPNVVMYHDPRSLHAEQYRTCRTNLTALNRGGAPWALVVTSSRKGEGKSVTAANLAVCLAELPGTRVCLIDADFRASAQANTFGVDNSPGLAELLRDKAKLGEVFHGTAIAQLDVMPSGDEPQSPAELLGGERFANLLGELKRRYTWIVIDTPPVNPYTDACVASSRTNGALLVVRMQQTQRDMVQRAAQSIVAAGGRLLGTFLTGLPTDREQYDYYTYNRSSTSADKPKTKNDAARQRARRDTERRLRQQEKAYLRQTRQIEAKDEEPEEPQV